jgi:uncharacterized protein YbjT (DUF2867 family)
MTKKKGIESRQILLTGASGYVGSRLWPKLETQGYRVRCMARNPEKLHNQVGSETEVVKGNVLDIESLHQALKGVWAAYYMIHSMNDTGDFETKEYAGANNFVQAAQLAGVQRIIYLGGLGDETQELSKHLRSRHEVGRIFQNSGIPTLEFRASAIIGAGSLSFELVRALVDRLPVMITPRWVAVPTQPISINDLLAYLLEALDLSVDLYDTYEIGGTDVVSYGDLMRVYARLRGRRLLILPVPVLTPYLSSLWLGLVTPLYARVGRKLIEGVAHVTVVNDKRALQVFSVQPMGVEDAMRFAMESEMTDRDGA